MPKPLREMPPTSSVARLLDPAAAARAVAPVQSEAGWSTETPTATPMPPVSIQTVKYAKITPEFVLNTATAQTLDQLVELYRRTTGTRLSNSHVLRAILKGVAHCMDSLEREARRISPTKLPSNARGRESDRERFESRLAEAFVAGIRGASAFDADKQ